MSAEQGVLGLPGGPLAPKKRRRRRERDAYLSALWQVRTLLEHFPEIAGDSLGDPTCGDGRMARMIMEAGRFRRCYLNDLVEPDALAVRGCVYASQGDGAAEDFPRTDWEVSNFPFNAAGEIVWAALKRARVGVAALLRCTFGEPCDASPAAPRGARKWLVRRPPTGIIMMPRYSYTGDGKCDSAPHWWFIWSNAIPPRIVVVDAIDVGQLGLEVAGGR